MINQALILAGGFGKRAESFGKGMPKSLLMFNGKSLLDYQLEELSKSSIKKITFLLGHQSEQIILFLSESNWHDFFDINFIVETVPKGTGGALVNAQNLIDDEFLLLCGDLILKDVIVKFIQSSKELKNVILHRASEHIFDSNSLIIDYYNRINQIFIKPHPTELYIRNRAFTGIYKLSKEFVIHLERIFGESKFDLDSEGIKMSIPGKHVFYSVSVSGFIRDVGTLERFHEVSNMISKLESNLKNKAVFFDRDGVINLNNGYINNPNNLTLTPGVEDFIKKIKQLGYLVIVVTNQPIIARGEISYPDLELIHAKIDSILAENRTFIDDYFVCPHHPHKGFTGEILSLKIICQCRKPKPGLLNDAVEKFSISIKDSFMIGDSESDNLAANALGLKYINMNFKESELKLNDFNSFQDVLQVFWGLTL